MCTSGGCRIVESDHLYSGYGYKVCRVVDVEKGIYAPLFQYFQKDGSGGKLDLKRVDKPYDFWKVRTEYKIGRTYRVRHSKKATDFDDYSNYRAGVCLFKKPFLAQVEYAQRIGQVGYLAILYCRYNHAIRHDGNIIVALTVQPIKVIKSNR